MADVSSTKSLMESCFRRRSRKSSLSITSTRRLMASYGLHHSRTFASGTNLISQFTASRGRHRSKCFTLGIALRPAHPTVFHGRTPLSGSSLAFISIEGSKGLRGRRRSTCFTSRITSTRRSMSSVAHVPSAAEVWWPVQAGDGRDCVARVALSKPGLTHPSQAAYHGPLF